MNINRKSERKILPRGEGGGKGNVQGTLSQLFNF